MTATLESKGVDEFGSGRVAEQDTGTAALKSISPYISRQPDWLENLLRRIERLLPAGLKPKSGYLFSFKNRILISTLVVVIGGVIIVGVILQMTVFPRLKADDPSVILNLIKIIHFVVSIVVIAASCLFIQLLSKNITLPLLELTKCADQISREAGENLASEADTVEDESEKEADYQAIDCLPADEVCQLTSSFNRMLIHLKASEASLRESEEKYRFLFDNAPSPIFVLDAGDLTILDVNARAEEEYQYSREELLKMTFADLGRDKDRDQTRRLLTQLAPTETTLLPVLRHTRRDGTPSHSQLPRQFQSLPESASGHRSRLGRNRKAGKARHADSSRQDGHTGRNGHRDRSRAESAAECYQARLRLRCQENQNGADLVSRGPGQPDQGTHLQC